MIFASGNTLQTVDLLTNTKRILMGRGKATNSGVAAVAVHPSGKFVAVAEKGAFPNILVYSYPALEIVRILRRGTERAYSDLTFSRAGDKIASVGGDPDFLLTVWDWARERVLLRSKAFSQEVYRVTFSPNHEGRLITSGTGHIRFWKMANTFTGLKLQVSRMRTSHALTPMRPIPPCTGLMAVRVLSPVPIALCCGRVVLRCDRERSVSSEMSNCLTFAVLLNCRTAK
jgi:WD40 repeat protein